MNFFVFSALNSIAGNSPILDSVIVFVADYLAFVLFFVLVAYESWQWMRNRKDKARHLLISIAVAGGAWAIAHALKSLIASPRPLFVLKDINVLIEHSNSDSFPSGHTTFFFALGVALFLRYDRRLGVFFMAFALLMGTARVVSGIHWPVDILGGVFLGFLTAVCILKFFGKNIKHLNYCKFRRNILYF